MSEAKIGVEKLRVRWVGSQGPQSIQGRSVVIGLGRDAQIAMEIGIVSIGLQLSAELWHASMPPLVGHLAVPLQVYAGTPDNSKPDRQKVTCIKYRVPRYVIYPPRSASSTDPHAPYATRYTARPLNPLIPDKLLYIHKRRPDWRIDENILPAYKNEKKRKNIIAENEKEELKMPDPDPDNGEPEAPEPPHQPVVVLMRTPPTGRLAGALVADLVELLAQWNPMRIVVIASADPSEIRDIKAGPYRYLRNDFVDLIDCHRPPAIDSESESSVEGEASEDSSEDEDDSETETERLILESEDRLKRERNPQRPWRMVDTVEERFEKFGWHDFEAEKPKGTPVRGAGFGQKIFDLCTEKKIPSIMLFKYTHDSFDNSNGAEMLTEANKLVDFFCDERHDSAARILLSECWEKSELVPNIY